MKLFGSNIKKFRKRKLQKNPYISGNGNLKKLLIFWEIKLYSPPREKCVICQETKTQKKFLIFSQKKGFFIFMELSNISGGTSKAPKTKISYISP